MNATSQELNGYQLWVGILGWNTTNATQKSQEFLDDAYRYSRIPECIQGLAWYNYSSLIKGHRHDQTILSILKERYQLKTWPISIYGCWQSHRVATDTNAVVYVHRRTYRDHSGLRFYTNETRG